MKELMVPVERAVRAVHASAARKRRMRQELLAHLTAIFEEERARGGDEQLALAQAVRRFGDPADLTRDLQASVPRLERWLLGLLHRRPGERGLWHALRLAALFAAAVFGAHLLFPLVQVAAGDDWSAVRIGLAPQAVVTGYGFLSVLVGYGLCRELADRLGVASLLRAAAYGVVAVLVGVAQIAGGYVTQPDNPLWEFIILRSPGDPLALSALGWFTGIPLVLALVAALLVRLERAREQRRGDWASLELGE
jgi:hypothetical protein